MADDFTDFDFEVDMIIEDSGFDQVDDTTTTDRPKYMRHFRTEEDRQRNIIALAQDIYDNNRTVRESELKSDKNWIEASRLLHKYVNGFDIEGDDEMIANYGLYYMMETYDQKDNTWAGVVRALEGIVEDPASYMFGAGIFGKKAGAEAAKEGIKAMLKKQVAAIAESKTKSAAVGGATYTGIDDALRQNVAIEAKAQEEYDPVRGATSSAAGAVAGATLVNVPEGAKIVKETVEKAIK
jgi:hypothetical protein